ncbi:MAG TPA: polyphenol oxidase family protein [Solirubrobacteraceae bacterium]|nr:polyphenol oxidase family protein [Solirubrobacteraceae bacterium]
MISLNLPGGRILFTGREQGDIRRPADASALAEAAGRPLVFVRQVHGAEVRSLTAETGDELVEADGQATSRRDVAPAVLTADCLPVVIVGDGALAVVHAGWRGLHAGVVEEGIAAVRRLGVTGPLSAAIGPGAGPCCYVVGDDVRALFGTTEPTLDLKASARRRLNAAGVDHVEDAGVCTVCDSRYFSYRREGDAAGRQAAVAWLTR